MNNQQSFYEQKLQHEIDSWDLYDSLQQGKKIVVVDARSYQAFELEHIPEAINIPHRNMNKESTTQLNKDTLYVCYCDGIGYNASTRGALNLSKLGFHVKELMGGLDWWKRDGYETEGNQASTGKKIICGC